MNFKIISSQINDLTHQLDNFSKEQLRIALKEKKIPYSQYLPQLFTEAELLVRIERGTYNFAVKEPIYIGKIEQILLEAKKRQDKYNNARYKVVEKTVSIYTKERIKIDAELRPDLKVVEFNGQLIIVDQNNETL